MQTDVMYNNILTTHNIIVKLNNSGYDYDEKTINLLKEIILLHVMSYTSYSIINRDNPLEEESSSLIATMKQIIDKEYNKPVFDKEMLDRIMKGLHARVKYLNNHGQDIEIFNEPMVPGIESIKYLKHMI